MRPFRRSLALSTILILIFALPATATHVPSAASASQARAPSATAAGDDFGLLVDIRAAHHPGYDRIVFEFEGRVPSTRTLEWVHELWYDSAGPERRAHVAGYAFLRLQFTPAWGLRFDTGNSSYGRKDRAYALPNLAEVKEIGDWEGYLTFGIGLMQKTNIVRTLKLTHPSQFVVDIATDFKRIGIQETFFNETDWSFHEVSRPVPTGDVPRAALMRMFAGPTAGERADGFRFISSGATGFRDLRVSDAGVARVTLRGGCDSLGSTWTIANEIGPTLKALPGISWVKIYDPNGDTERPHGLTDSIPACLEP